MRGLLRFIYKYRAFELFILLEVIGISLLINNNRYYKVSYLNTSNAVVGEANQRIFNTQKYVSLREVDEELAQECVVARAVVAVSLYRPLSESPCERFPAEPL